MNGTNVRRYLFLGLFLGLLLLVGKLFYPFMTIILWSGILYAILEPIQLRILRRRGGAWTAPGPRRLVAAILALAGILLVVLPVVYLVASLAREVFVLGRSVRSAIEADPALLDLSPSSPVGGFIWRATDGVVDLSRVNIRGELARILAGSANSILGFSGRFLRNAFGLVLGLVFMVITLFFLLMDGRHLMRVLVGAIPIEREYTMLFLRKLQSTARDLARGYTIIMALIAAVMFGVYSLFGVRGALFFGVLTALSTFVPVAGPALVLIPVAAIQAIGGPLAPALALLVVGVAAVTVIDTLVRPLLLKDRLELHPLLILFAIVGGIELFGFNGVVLGPLVLILFFTSVELYDKVYERGPAVGEEEGEGPRSGEGRP